MQARTHVFQVLLDLRDPLRGQAVPVLHQKTFCFENVLRRNSIMYERQSRLAADDLVSSMISGILITI